MAGIDTSSRLDVSYDTAVIANVWQTQRLRFIKIDENREDVKAFLATTQNDPVLKSLVTSAPLKPSAKTEIDDLIKGFVGCILGVAVCLREDGTQEDGKPPTIIGTMGLGWGGISQKTAQHRNVHMGLSFAKEYQNKGYGGEALQWMLDWAFGHMGLHTVSLIAIEFNQRGIHLYKKLGFRVEGRRKEVCWFNDEWWDEIDFGMTEDEWRALKARK